MWVFNSSLVSNSILQSLHIEGFLWVLMCRSNCFLLSNNFSHWSHPNSFKFFKLGGDVECDDCVSGGVGTDGHDGDRMGEEGNDGD